MEELKVVVVAGREKSKNGYDKIYPAFVRLIDVLLEDKSQKTKIIFKHNGATQGNLGEFMGVLNVFEVLLRNRGVIIQREKHKMDIVLHGAEVEAKWVEENSQDADAIFFIDDKSVKRNVRDKLDSLDIYTMEVKV